MLTTYVCSMCGSRSEGARSRDVHAGAHMLIREPWVKKAMAKKYGELPREYLARS